MLPELTIERVFRRELDALPLPAEERWVPASTAARRSALLTAIVSMSAVVLVFGAAFAIWDVIGAGRTGTLSSPRPFPPRPTCVDGVCIAPLPNLYRNPTVGYNLVIPGDWVEVVLGAAGTPGLIERRIFTARTPQSVAGTNEIPAVWDLLVEVWQRGDRSVVDWARTGPCADDVVAQSRTVSCELTTQTLRGAPTAVTTARTNATASYTRSYYIDHRQQVIVLRYRVDPGVSAPPGVSEATFERIVRQIGLV
jgi:hypothetical protein